MRPASPRQRGLRRHARSCLQLTCAILQSPTHAIASAAYVTRAALASNATLCHVLACMISVRVRVRGRAPGHSKEQMGFVDYFPDSRCVVAACKQRRCGSPPTVSLVPDEPQRQQSSAQSGRMGRDSNDSLNCIADTSRPTLRLGGSAHPRCGLPVVCSWQPRHMQQASVQSAVCCALSILPAEMQRSRRRPNECGTVGMAVHAQWELHVSG